MESLEAFNKRCREHQFGLIKSWWGEEIAEAWRLKELEKARVRTKAEIDEFLNGVFIPEPKDNKKATSRN